MNLYEIDEPGRAPMIIGGSAFGVEDARYLQESIREDGRRPEETVVGIDTQTLERTLPVADLAITQYE
ncbi:MAG: hypothetical protein U5L95_02405 [Candidatus Saccharibacteria bacterium]|nr:hypothetical protein [Candidatus Saccharibacteria bacterium]